MENNRSIDEHREHWIPKFQATGKIQDNNLNPTEESAPSPRHESTEPQEPIQTPLEQSEEPLYPGNEINRSPF